MTTIKDLYSSEEDKNVVLDKKKDKNESSRKYRAMNKEKVQAYNKEYNKKYRESHKKEIAEYAKRYMDKKKGEKLNV
jgi:hypothetical protein